MNIREKLVRVITMFLIFVLGFTLYQAFITPKRHGINSLRNNLKNINAQISNVLGEEVVLRGGEAEEKQLQKFLDELILQIPSEKDIPKIINQLLTKGGKGLKIDYTLIQPRKLEPKGRYKKVPIEIKFITTYPHFKLYLTQLKNLPEVFVIDKLDMRRMPGQPELLSVHLIIAAFVIPGGVEEKIDAMAKGTYPKETGVSPFKPKFVGQATPQENGSLVETSPDLTKPEAPLNLQGIMQTVQNGKNIKAAIINDHIVYVGDYIEGYKIVNVRENYVVLKKGSRKKILKLNE